MNTTNSDEKDAKEFYTKIKIDPTKTKLDVGQKIRIDGFIYIIKNTYPIISANGKFVQELELSVLTGYLVCHKCKAYYKLQLGEKPEDFTNKCTCGGSLRYAMSIDVIEEKRTLNGLNDKKKKK